MQIPPFMLALGVAALILAIALAVIFVVAVRDDIIHASTPKPAGDAERAALDAFDARLAQIIKPFPERAP